MKIEIEDVVFSFLALVVFALFLAMNVQYDAVIPSLAILWIGLTLLVVGHSYIYRKKKRDMIILKMRFLFSVIPAYLLLLYFSYQEMLDYDRSRSENLLLSGIVLLIIILNAVGEYVLKRKK